MKSKRTAKLKASRRVALHAVVRHLIYGDIGEMPLNVLGDECPTHEDYQRLDAEQDTRLQAAATVQAWLEGRLHRSGYIHDPQRHGEGDKVPNDKLTHGDQR